MTQGWEYKTVNLDWTSNRDDVMNCMGREGWELAQIEPQQLVAANMGTAGIVAIMTFKRPIVPTVSVHEEGPLP